jgi:hypothetical protein
MNYWKRLNFITFDIFLTAKCAMIYAKFTRKINYRSLEMVLLYDFRHFFNRKGRKDLRKVHKENKLLIARNGSTL